MDTKVESDIFQVSTYDSANEKHESNNCRVGKLKDNLGEYLTLVAIKRGMGSDKLSN